MNLNTNVFVAMHIGTYDTKIGFATSLDDKKIIDMSYGYGKSFMTSSVIFDDSEQKFLFFDEAFNFDLDDESIVFNSIIDIINYKEEHIKILEKKFSKDEILTCFLKRCLEYLEEVLHDYSINRICFSYDKVNGENLDYLFVKALEALNINAEKICFIDKKEALYLSLNNIEDKEFQIFFLDNTEASYINLYKEDTNIFREVASKINNLETNFLHLEISNLINNEYMKALNLTNLSLLDKFNLDKIIKSNIDLIFSKYLNNEEIKLFINNSFPPVELKLKLKDIDMIMNSLCAKKIESKLIKAYIYTENIDYRIYREKLIIAEEIIEINLIYALLEKAIKNNAIKIIETRDIENEYGFLINYKNEDFFYPIITKKNYNILDGYNYYFYLNKKIDSNISIYKKNEEKYSVFTAINLESLNINTEFTRIKVTTLFTKNKSIDLIIENKGFINSKEDDVLGQVCFNINEV